MAYSYARRKELALQRGYSSESQQRRARYALAHNPNVQTAWEAASQIQWAGELEETDLSDEEVYARWFRAFADKKDRFKNEDNRKGAKARWFVEVTGQVASYDEWDKRYARH